MYTIFTKNNSPHIPRMASLLVIVFLFFTSLLPAQSSDSTTKKVSGFWKWRLLHKARRFEDRGKYERAHACFNRILQADSSYFKANYELGMECLLTANHRNEALPLLQRALRHMPADTVVQVYWYLGNAYHFAGRYEEAITNFQIFQRKGGDDMVGEWQGESSKRIAQCQSAIALRATAPKNIRVVNLGDGINTAWAEYVPVINAGDSILLFTSRRSSTTGGRIDWADEKFFEDMYISRDDSSNFKTAQPFRTGGSYIGNLMNTRDHESVVSLTGDEKVLVLYSRNDLYFSLRDSARNWTNPVKFDQRINCGEYQPHGSFTADGTTFYFTSDVKGGAGGLDLYYVERFDDGTWSDRKSLGPLVNTEADEDSPQIGADGKTLYFSSKGHNSIGGYDVFYTRRDSLGNWTTPVNLGFPYNSPGDDIFFKADSSLQNGYLASFRLGGFGDMDIYRFKTWNKADFNDCHPFANRKYQVSVDASNSIDPVGRAVVYRWEMGNGDIRYGKKISYDYKRPGDYKLVLTILDPETGVLETDEYVTDIKLPQHEHLEIVAADTVCQDSLVKLDGTHCYFDGQGIIGYFWDVNGKQWSDSVYLNQHFHALGAQQVRLQVVSVLSDTSLPKRWCTEKTIEVLSPEEYAAYLRRKAQRDNSIPQDVRDSLDIQNPIDVLVVKDGAGSNSGTGSLQDHSTIAGSIVLQPIFYDFDISEIRADARQTLDSNIAILRAHPDMIIRVVSHADARGTDVYNIGLSQRRAQAAVAYLESHGVPRKRIIAIVAVGERAPVNPCLDGVDCDEQQHQQNRRTDFVLIPSTH